MKRLVLFDIDGTLIYHVGTRTQVGFPRFLYAVKKVFGIDADIDTSVNYNGWTDPLIISWIVRPYGISSQAVWEHMDALGHALQEYAGEQAKSGGKLYDAIPEALNLISLLRKRQEITLALLTGNVERMARWKLAHAGVPYVFRFGLFGEEADDRNVLAAKVFEKFRTVTGNRVSSSEIVILGDAVPDILCARAIGAVSIIVMTGRHSSREDLAREHPTILADTLMDPAVRRFFAV
ncbi:haloacid dehalogenase-like hydrolase [Patescibacteria group bacterium]|nr:haloacid dehalogenase-like hydrolase [Patescibacteria group bacterium]